MLILNSWQLTKTSLKPGRKVRGGCKSLSVTERQVIIEESKKLVDQIKNKMEVL